MENLDNFLDNLFDLVVDLKANHKEVVDEVYSKYHDLVNMSYSELKAWSETECSKKASLDRGPINRNLKIEFYFIKTMQIKNLLHPGKYL